MDKNGWGRVMTDFLLELLLRRNPRPDAGGCAGQLPKLFTAELAKAGLSAGEIVTYAGPRRLALIARGLPAATEAVSEEVKGPRASAPPQALEGFLRKTGLTREQLTERDGVLFAITEKPGRATAQVLAEAIPAIVRAFPWPKSMRWGTESASTESMRWVRPLHAIVALFGGEVVPFEIAGINSGNVTRGHRFHAPAEIVLTALIPMSSSCAPPRCWSIRTSAPRSSVRVPLRWPPRPGWSWSRTKVWSPRMPG